MGTTLTSRTVALLFLLLLAVSSCMAVPPATRVGGAGRCNCACGSPGGSVCAQEGRGAMETFPSKCHLECYNCTEDRQFVMIHKGVCQESGRSGGR